MPWKPGKGSPNPGGRPRVAGSIRARARVDSHRAYDRLVREMDHKDPRVAVPACVHVLRLAGASFASEAEETKAQAEAAKSGINVVPTSELERLVGRATEPLN